MIDEKDELKLALARAISATPKITRAMIDASLITRRRGWRQVRLAEAVALARALHDDLAACQARLGWRETEDA